VLGSHVEQAGQSVTAKSLRFDFTHFSALTQEELSDVERLVNEAVWAAVPVETKECDLEEAKAAGAMALFGEKYGARVRVVRVGEYSAELCGGTHAENSGNLGLFHVLYENSVASGIRRIEGLTAALAMDFFARQQASLQRSAALLKANNANELEARAAAVMAQLKEKEREATALAAQLSGFRVQELLQGAQTIGTLRFVCGLLDSADAEDLRQACDSVKESGERTAALFARRTEKGTLQFAAACTAAAVASGAHAGNLVRAAAQAAGGSGGGKAESAMAGGKDPAKLEDAFGAARALLASIGTEGFQ
jgi:alanyl-tRNA synthetase